MATRESTRRANNRNVKLQKTVRQVLKYAQLSDLSKEKLEVMVRKKYFTLWICTILVFLCLCGFQITDRVLWFLSHPSVTDVSYHQPKSEDSFQFKFYKTENDYVKYLLETKSIYWADHDVPYMPLVLAEINGTDIKKLWQFGNMSNIIQTAKSTNHKLEEVNLIKQLKFLNTVTVLGQLTEFSLRSTDLVNSVEIVLKPMPLLQLHVIIINDMTIFGAGDFVGDTQWFAWKLSVREYIHRNTPLKPCTPYREYNECNSKCAIKTYKRAANCRLPIDDESVILPDCNYTNIRPSYLLAIKILVEPDLFGECNCPRACERVTFSIEKQFRIEPSRISTLMLFSMENMQVSLTERRAYDEIGLITDVGGNLGLYFGISLLMMIDFIQKTFIWTEKYNTNKNSSEYKLIVTTYKKYHLQQQSRTGDNFILKTVNVVVWITCSCFALFMIQERIRYYLNSPTTFVIEAEMRKFVALPPVTICGLSPKIAFSMKKHAKKNNIKDMCSIDMVDLIDVNEENSADSLWKKTYIEPVQNIADTVEKRAGAKMPKANTTSISTHLGDCLHILSEPTEYFAITSLYPIFFTMSRVCREHPYQLFIDDFGSNSYNILTGSIFLSHFISYYEFSVTIVNRLAIGTNSCVDKQIYTDCRQTCLHQQILTANLCRLPFLSNYSESLPRCNSTKQIKQSVEKYVRILFNVTKREICSCKKPCSENVINVLNNVIWHDDKLVVLTYLKMLSNTYEILTEILEYTLVSLFCDIGNSLGIALGMSILDILSHVKNFGSKITSLSQ